MSIERINLFGAEIPYSDAVLVDGTTLYLSGLVSENMETGEAVSGDITIETRTILTNLKSILEKVGSDMDHVIRVDIMLKNFGDRVQMNEEYVKHFKADQRPARVCFGVSDLYPGSNIEMMVVAQKCK